MSHIFSSLENCDARSGLAEVAAALNFRARFQVGCFFELARHHFEICDNAIIYHNH